MTIDFFYPEAGTTTTESDPKRPAKSDLVGEVLVVTTTSYDPAAESQYGDSTAEWTGKAICCGPKYNGLVLEDQKFWGNLGKNLGDIPVGRTAVVKVISGRSAGGRQFYGADICHPRSAEAVLAQQVLAAADGQQAGEGFPF